MEIMMLANKFVAIGMVCVIATLAWAQDAGDARRGIAFAQAACASCHGVVATDRSSPRPDAAPFTTIANTPGMTGIAIAVWLQTPHKSMPDLIIAQQDRNDVISYILTLRDAPAAK